MAEAFVRPLTDKLISILAQKLVQELFLVTGFRHDFQWMCDELNNIKSILDDAREKRKHSDSKSLTNWLHKLQEFLEDAVDIMEDCEGRKFRNPVSRHRMGSKIKMLKDKLTKIQESAKYLHYVATFDAINPRAEAFNAYSEDRRKKSSALVKQSIQVGMTNDIKKITNWILQDGFSVIAIVGIGGMGKTLLLQNVFNGQRVQERFDHLVWLAVSQKFVVDQLLVEMGTQIKLPDDQMRLADLSPEALRDRIHIHLRGKRVLFVLDDVWDRNALDKIDLPRDNNKFLVTTRDHRVADTMRATRTLPMAYLSEDDSLELFCMYAFADCEKCKPPDDLKELAEQIVKKCYRLPLAVKTIGAYMANVKRIGNEWKSTLDRLEVEAHMNDRVMPGLHRVNVEADMYDQVLTTLRVSYQALPDHLKPCFLYCSAFPRNTQINCEYLVHAWIAEGFVSGHQEGGGDRYDVARSYLKVLIERCVIEVSQVGGDGREMYCKMHDLLHELARYESKATKCFFKAGKELQEFPVDECRGARRISMIKTNISTVKGNIESPKLRSLLLWNNIQLKSISATFINKVRHLTVLDISQSPIESLPKSIEKLHHLKLLNLSGTKIKKFPGSLSGLINLQFLDVSRCNNLQRLHSAVGKHKLMVHLNLEGCRNLELVPPAISKLVSLRTLKGVILKTDSELKEANTGSLQWTDLKCLTLLENLSITFTISDTPLELEWESESQCIKNLAEGTFGGMRKMRTLFLVADGHDNSSLLHLPNDMDVMQGLEILHLRNCFLPKCIFELQNLMELKLDGDNSASADYRGIERIPNLVKLIFSRNKRCIEFPEEFGKPVSFSKLEKLIIEDFDKFEKFPALEEGAMPMLKYLRVKNCNRMKDINERGSLRFRRRSSKVRFRMSNPLRVKNSNRLASLEEVEVVGCQLWEEGIRNGGFYWQKLKERGIKIKVIEL